MSPTFLNGVAAFLLGFGLQAVSDAPWWQQVAVIFAVIGAYFWVQAGVEAEAHRRGRVDGLREARRIAIGLRGGVR